jgi:predicted aspartyl protease
MPSGFFTSDFEPAIELEVVGPDGARSFEAVIDTGFNGGVTLPIPWIEDLGLSQTGDEQMVLADGSLTAAPLFDAYVILNETAHDVVVAGASGKPLAGTNLFRGFSLYVEFQPDGAVDIKRLSESTGDERRT